MEAFRDTEIFSQLVNPNSVVYKVLLSPFFRELKMSHYLKDKGQVLDTYVMTNSDYQTIREEQKRRALSISTNWFVFPENADIFSF